METPARATPRKGGRKDAAPRHGYSNLEQHPYDSAEFVEWKVPLHAERQAPHGAEVAIASARSMTR